mmetsp:Transcript_43135/g.125603  ORF Transcript_43135/g.125603 Transcript_43135/m.125603 type:complete len:219 (+) Transcript_43135:2334-2990(+)
MRSSAFCACKALASLSPLVRTEAMAAWTSDNLAFSAAISLAAWAASLVFASTSRWRWSNRHLSSPRPVSCSRRRRSLSSLAWPSSSSNSRILVCAVASAVAAAAAASRADCRSARKRAASPSVRVACAKRSSSSRMRSCDWLSSPAVMASCTFKPAIADAASTACSSFCTKLACSALFAPTWLKAASRACSMLTSCALRPSMSAAACLASSMAASYFF